MFRSQSQPPKALLTRTASCFTRIYIHAGYRLWHSVVLFIRRIHSANVSRECHISIFIELYAQQVSLYCYETTRKLLVDYTMSDISHERSCKLYEFIIYTVIVGLLVIVGIIGNSLTFVVFWSGKFNKSTSFLFMCLSLTDSAVLLSISVWMSLLPFKESTRYPQYFYNVYPYIIVYVFPLCLLAQTATVWVTVLISVNRFINVCLPLRASQWCTISQVKKEMAGVLLFAVLYSIPTFAESRIEYVMPNNTNNITFNRTNYIARVAHTRLWFAYGYYLIYHIVLCGMFIVILPTSILALLNICLVKALKARRRKKVHTLHSQHESSMTLVLLIIVFVSIVCQLPALVTRMLSIDATEEASRCGGYMFYIVPITNMLVILNSAINFIIYIIFNKRFRDVLMEKVFKRHATEQVVICDANAGAAVTDERPTRR